MTAIPDVRTRPGRVRGTPSTMHVVEDTYWGYIVRSTAPVSLLILWSQGLCLILGSLLVAATLALWLLPSGVTGAQVLGMKIALSVVTGAVAAHCLWFATRGTQTELQIDTMLGEVREVLRNRAGRPTTLGRYGFDAIGSVFIERRAGAGAPGTLVLRYRNTAQTLQVATGPALDLAPLRDRLGRDLMVVPRNPLRAPVPGPEHFTDAGAEASAA